MKIPKKPERGYKRQWLRCRTCKAVQYYDYIPYSLSNPIMTTICGHGATLRDMGCDPITEKVAIATLKRLPPSDTAPRTAETMTKVCAVDNKGEK